MKYNKETIKTITNALSEGQGRVRACKMAGIHYDTFMEWMRNKPDFSETVKKAERVGNSKIKDICKRRIIEDTSWQSAAWWLERNYPEQYGRRYRYDVTSGNSPIGTQIIIDGAVLPSNDLRKLRNARDDRQGEAD